MSHTAKTKKKNASSKESWFSDLVASAKGGLVPVRKTEPVDPAREKTLTTIQSDSVPSTATRVSIRVGDVTTPSRIQAAQNQSQNQKRDTAISAAPAEDKAEKNRRIGIVLLVLTFALIAYGLLSSTGGQSAPGAKYDRAKIEERVNYHRQRTGLKLNSERINAEYENMRTAPTIPYGAKKVPAPNMMEGVPLAAEPIHRRSSRDRMMPTNPDHPDARVMYGLQEEQAANEWEDEARKMYIDEFVKNAAASGYKVKVDNNYNVTVQPGRRPQSSEGGADFESSAAQ